MKEIEEKTGKDIRDLLNELYRDKNMTFQEMESYFKSELSIKVNFSTLFYWFMKFGMETRSFKL
jgi:hypothetical protein